MHLVVGLGNPGRRYQGTRHNVGFLVVDRLAGKLGAEVSRRGFEGAYTEARDGEHRLVLLEPHTYMNLSGQSVRAATDWFKLTPDAVMAVCDDIHLEPGKLRIRRKGSSGGQKGLESIGQHLGTEEFSRLRVGVGAPELSVDWARWVLEPFAEAERAGIDEAVDRAAEAVLAWVRDGIEACMNRFNG